MDARVLALDGNRLRVGIWQLDCSAANHRRLGARPMGAPCERLGVAPGALAVIVED